MIRIDDFQAELSGLSLMFYLHFEPNQFWKSSTDIIGFEKKKKKKKENY